MDYACSCVPCQGHAKDIVARSCNIPIYIDAGMLMLHDTRAVAMLEDIANIPSMAHLPGIHADACLPLARFFGGVSGTRGSRSTLGLPFSM